MFVLPGAGTQSGSQSTNCTACHRLFIVVEKNHAVKGNGVLAWGFALTMFLMLWHLGPGWVTKDCSSQGYPILRASKGLQSRFHTPITSFYQFQHSGPLFTYPNNSRARYQTTKDSSYAQNPLKSSRLVTPKPGHCASPIPFCRNHNETTMFPLAPPASWPILVLLCVALQGTVCLPSCWELCLFNGSPLLICWPHHTRMIIKSTF